MENIKKMLPASGYVGTSSTKLCFESCHHTAASTESSFAFLATAYGLQSALSLVPSIQIISRVTLPHIC